MKTIMIVDDAKTVRIYHKAIISTDNRHVLEAENGIEALEKSMGQPVDLFMLDVNMPKMDGYRLCRELRNNEDTKAVPVVMISTESAAGDAAKAYSVGANYYLNKPVDADYLAEIVTLLLGDES